MYPEKQVIYFDEVEIPPGETKEVIARVPSSIEEFRGRKLIMRESDRGATSVRDLSGIWSTCFSRKTDEWMPSSHFPDAPGGWSSFALWTRGEETPSILVRNETPWVARWSAEIRDWFEEEDHLARMTDAEAKRSAMSDAELAALRDDLASSLERDGINSSEPWKAVPDPRAEALMDVLDSLRARESDRRAQAVLSSEAWRENWRTEILHLGRELAYTRMGHVSNARSALLSAVYGVECYEPRVEGYSVGDTSKAFENLRRILRVVTATIPTDVKDEVVLALRRIYEDEKEPFFSYEVAGPPGNSVPVYPEDKKRSDDRVARYAAVWRNLEYVVWSTP